MRERKERERDPEGFARKSGFRHTTALLTAILSIFPQSQSLSLELSLTLLRLPHAAPSRDRRDRSDNDPRQRS